MHQHNAMNLILPPSFIPMRSPEMPKRSQRRISDDEEEVVVVDESNDTAVAAASDTKEEEKVESHEAAVSPKEEEEEDTKRDTTVDELVSTKTLRDLKDMCIERGLSDKGKKAELAARLVG